LSPTLQFPDRSRPGHRRIVLGLLAAKQSRTEDDDEHDHRTTLHWGMALNTCDPQGSWETVHYLTCPCPVLRLRTEKCRPGQRFWGHFMNSHRHLLIAFLVLCTVVCHSAAQIVAFGASNVSGYKVEPSQAWPAQLEMLLQAKGYNVRVFNAGLNGDTTTHMLERADSSIPNGTKIVVLDMGGGFFNDKMRNISHDQGEKDMHTLFGRLRARGIKIVPEYSYKMPEKFKQADKVHLNVAGHEELAKILLPEVIAALNP
jgi:acyl-CoA thioesterase-1